MTNMTEQPANKEQVYHCLLTNESISKAACNSFQAGEQMGSLQSDAYDPATLPCLQCEGLIRPL